MQAVFEKFWNPADQRHARISVCLQLMKEVDALYMKHRMEYRVPTEAARRIVEASFEIAQITTGLVRYYHARGTVAFHYTKKCHDCLHAALASKYCNPMHADCSSGEDFMKVAKQAIRGSMYGNRLGKVGNVALRKYVKAWHIKNGQRRAWWNTSRMGRGGRG